MLSEPGDSLFEKTRIEALTDAIFAVTMTLLVLDLKLPARHGAPQFDWPTAVSIIEPRLLSYVVSFIVLCVFWTGHVRLMRLLRNTDHGFIWLNLLFLLATTFVPFTTSLGADYDLQIVDIIYGANIALILGIHFLLWHHLLIRPHLHAQHLPAGVGRVVRQRFALAFGVVVLAIALAFVHPQISTGAYALLLLMGLFRPKGPRDSTHPANN
jgi:uncharacterized membrane protein